ncbi:MAG: hypothetical protein PHP88_00685 [bacterium]|nr:hypothetical protein [bacterium]
MLKVLDMAREGHSFLVDSSLRLQVEIAKTYMWVSSILAGAAMFIVKDLSLTPLSEVVLMLSLALTSISFGISLLVVWGRSEGKHALIEPMNLATFAHERFSNAEFPDTEVITGLIGAIQEANLTNASANMKRRQMLRAAALFLYLSFFLLCISIIARSLNV